MDLVDRIETTRFLGHEFLVWLWFKTEIHEATLKRADGSGLEIWLDSQLVLQSVSDRGERTTMKGVAPSGTVEAKVALENGKVPVRAKVSVSVENKDFSFVFDAPSFGFTSVKLPEVTEKDTDERFAERMVLLALLDDVIREQYLEFLLIRLSTLWDAELLPAIVRWTRSEETLSARAYRGLVQRAERE
jgi:hypothetical protein